MIFFYLKFQIILNIFYLKQLNFYAPMLCIFLRVSIIYIRILGLIVSTTVKDKKCIFMLQNITQYYYRLCG